MRPVILRTHSTIKRFDVSEQTAAQSFSEVEQLSDFVLGNF